MAHVLVCQTSLKGIEITSNSPTFQVQTPLLLAVFALKTRVKRGGVSLGGASESGARRLFSDLSQDLLVVAADVRYCMWLRCARSLFLGC